MLPPSCPAALPPALPPAPLLVGLAQNTLLLYNNVLALPLMAAFLLLATNEAAEVVKFPQVGG